MKEPAILNFREFKSIFEKEKEGEEKTQTGQEVVNSTEEVKLDPNNKNIKAVDTIMFIYFQIFGILATRSGGYPDAVKDYQTIANSKAKDRGQVMVNVIDKIIGILTSRFPIFSPVMEDYKKTVDLLRQAYDKIIEEDPKQAIGLSNRIKDMTIEYLNNLVNDVRNAKYPSPKKNESYEFYGELLLEKDLYYKERGSLIKRIVPLKSRAEELSSKSIFPEIQTAAKKTISLYDKIISSLEDDSFFDKIKKRADRAEKIQNYRYEILKIENDINSIMSKTIINKGIQKAIEDLINSAISSLNAANDNLKKIEKEKAEKSEKIKIEKEVEDKKSEDKKSDNSYKDIDKNTSSDVIKKLQDKLKIILPNSKIIPDGKYDGKLKSNINDSIKLMKSINIIKKDPYKDSLNISKITPELQKSIDEYIKKIEEFRKKK